jgi:hypothetical protein
MPTRSLGREKPVAFEPHATEAEIQPAFVILDQILATNCPRRSAILALLLYRARQRSRCRHLRKNADPYSAPKERGANNSGGLPYCFRSDYIG